MKTFILAILTILALNAAPAQTPTVSATPLLLSRSLHAAQMLTRELKGALMRHMARGGPTAAITVCADSAQLLTSALEDSLGLSIRRISTRWRNPRNAPEPSDSAALAAFEKMRASGTLTDTTFLSFEVPSDSALLVQTYVPIVTQPFCLTCHGQREALNRSLDSVLSVRYPGDRATGYGVGDVRGAIRIRAVRQR